MSSQPDLELISGNESLPDLAFQIPLDGLPDYPSVLELKSSATETHCAPYPPAKAARVSDNPDGGLTVPNVGRNTTARILGQQHPHHIAGPAEADTSSGGKWRSRVPGLKDCMESVTSISHIADNGSTEQASIAAEPCCHLSDDSSRHQDVTGQRSSISTSATGHRSCQPSHSPRSRSCGWMLDRWHAQPPSQEPYSPIKEVCSSRVIETCTPADGKKP
jgi:hypothetical protein